MSYDPYVKSEESREVQLSSYTPTVVDSNTPQPFAPTVSRTQYALASTHEPIESNNSNNSNNLNNQNSFYGRNNWNTIYKNVQDGNHSSINQSPTNGYTNGAQFQSPMVQGGVLTSTSPSQYVVGVAPLQPMISSVVTHQPGVPVHQTGPDVWSLRPPAGRWRDSIFDCCNNLFPSCWCACCCCYGMYLNAQISQKTGYASFQNVCSGFIALCFACLFLEIAIGRGFVWIPALAAFIFSILLRLHIVQKYQITECGVQAAIGEACCGFWCWYCSVAQMARHVYGYSKVFDGDADPGRADQYSREV